MCSSEEHLKNEKTYISFLEECTRIFLKDVRRKRKKVYRSVSASIMTKSCLFWKNIRKKNVHSALVYPSFPAEQPRRPWRTLLIIYVISERPFIAVLIPYFLKLKQCYCTTTSTGEHGLLNSKRKTRTKAKPRTRLRPKRASIAAGCRAVRVHEKLRGVVWQLLLDRAIWSILARRAT